MDGRIGNNFVAFKENKRNVSYLTDFIVKTFCGCEYLPNSFSTDFEASDRQVDHSSPFENLIEILPDLLQHRSDLLFFPKQSSEEPDELVQVVRRRRSIAHSVFEERLESLEEVKVVVVVVHVSRGIGRGIGSTFVVDVTERD